MDGDGYVALATPDHGAFKAHLHVHGGLERNLLHMHPGLVGVGVALETADEELVAKWPSDFRQAGDAKGLDAIDAKGVDVLCIIAPRKGAALCRPKPGVGFAEGDFVAPEMV